MDPVRPPPFRPRITLGQGMIAVGLVAFVMWAILPAVKRKEWGKSMLLFALVSEPVVMWWCWKTWKVPDEMPHEN